MCQYCSETAIAVLNKDTYEEMLAKKAEILSTPELQTEFEEAFSELLNHYTNFHEQVFRGRYNEEDESLLRRQTEWEKHFEELIERINHYTGEEADQEDEAGTSEAQPEEEPVYVQENSITFSLNSWPS